MKEIGGYLELERFAGQEYYPELIALNTGRNALLYLLKAKKIKKLFIPYFLCDCIEKTCCRQSVSYEYYHIDAHFHPVFDKTLNKDEYLYIVNYYGQLSDADILRMKHRYGNIILDNVQAFYQSPVDGVDSIYSCRKFFGVPDGGYLSTDICLDEPLDVDESRDRVNHMLGRFECSGEAYFSEYHKCESALDSVALKYMSSITHNLLRAIDYEEVRVRRSRNYAILSKNLDLCNPLVLKSVDGPFCYPFYCKNGLSIKKKLAEQHIYVPTLWPNVLSLDAGLELDYAANILPLPCDQRYEEYEMVYLCERLRVILKI